MKEAAVSSVTVRVYWSVPPFCHNDVSECFNGGKIQIRNVNSCDFLGSQQFINSARARANKKKGEKKKIRSKLDFRVGARVEVTADSTCESIVSIRV